MKIFGIGLAKTGTTSLIHALSMLGYKSKHCPVPLRKSLEIIDEYEAVADISVACQFQLLDGLYPGSKFILTVRSIPDWISSCEDHFYYRLPRYSWSAEALELHKGTWEATYGVSYFDRDIWINAYFSHVQKVMSHFSCRRKDILVLDICNKGEGWDKLCGFLNKDVPNVEFPWDNKAR